MHIVFFYPYKGTMTGGPTTFLNLLTGLNRREGIYLTLITQKESKFSKQLRECGVRVFILPFYELMKNQDREALNFSFFKKIQAAVQIFLYNIKLCKFLRSEECDVFITRNVKNITYSVLGVKLSRAILIWDIGLEPRSRGLVKYLHYIGLLLSDKIITQARAQPEQIFTTKQIRSFKSKFNTIYPGIDDNTRKQLLNRAVENSKEGEVLKIVCVASVVPRKNQMMILKSLEKDIRKKVSIDFIGPINDKKYYTALKKYISAHKLNKAVNFLGWKKNVPELLGDYDLLVLCSKSEGTPQVIREAMFAGLPAIVTNVGGMGEVVEHGKTGFIIQDFNVKDLIDYMTYFISNKEALIAFGKQSREVAENIFSYEKWISSYVSLIEACLEER